MLSHQRWIRYGKPTQNQRQVSLLELNQPTCADFSNAVGKAGSHTPDTLKRGLGHLLNSSADCSRSLRQFQRQAVLQRAAEPYQKLPSPVPARSTAGRDTLSFPTAQHTARLGQEKGLTSRREIQALPVPLETRPTGDNTEGVRVHLAGFSLFLIKELRREVQNFKPCNTSS